jgi:hypothetical protein
MEAYGFGPTGCSIQSSTQGLSILNRYITFRGDPEVQGHGEPPPSRPGPWNTEEREKLRESILAGNRNYTQLKVHFPDRSLGAIQRQGGRIEEELNYRAWEQRENEVILHFVRNGMANRLADVLLARNEHAIGDQIRYLQTIGLL